MICTNTGKVYRAPAMRKDVQVTRCMDYLCKSICLFANSRIKESVYLADGFQF